MALLTVFFPGAQAKLEPVEFQYSLTDAAGDARGSLVGEPGQAHCNVLWANSANNACDLLGFDAAVTDEAFIIQFTSGSLTFPASASSAGINFRVHFKDPAGTTYRAAARVTPSAVNAGATFSGDPAAPAGLAWTIDRTSNELRGSIPLDSLEEMAPGGKIVFVLIETMLNVNGGVQGSGLYVTQDAISPRPDFVIPAAGGGKTFFEKVTSETLGRGGVFANATNDTHVYEWENVHPSLEVVVETNVTRGAANLLVRDASNATLMNLTFDGSKTEVIALAEAPTGVWNITVAYADYVGAFNLTIAPPAETEAPAPSTPSITNETTTQNTTATAGQQKVGDDEGGGIPGPGPLAALLVLGAVAAAAHRRRRLG